MIIRFTVLLVTTLALGACGVEADFSDHQTYQVWRALQAAAEHPDYDHQDYTKRWTVMENIVHIDEDDRRIDIERRLERVLRRPRTKPLHQNETWHFQVHLLPGPENRVRFKNMAPAVPTHLQFEGERYFTEVRRLLAGLPPSRSLQEMTQDSVLGSDSDSDADRIP